jgi:hypothetical protein
MDGPVGIQLADRGLQHFLNADLPELALPTVKGRPLVLEDEGDPGLADTLAELGLLGRWLGKG